MKLQKVDKKVNTFAIFIWSFKSAKLYLKKVYGWTPLHKLYGINQGFRKVFEFPSEKMMNSFQFYRQTANSTHSILSIELLAHGHQLDWSNRDGWCLLVYSSHINININVNL